MEWGELLNWVLGILTVIAGGGWFVNWRAHKRQENAKAKQEEATAKEQEANAFKAMQDAYQQTLEDVNRTLADVRGERDHYRDERNELREQNNEMRKKYNDIEERMIQMDMQYKRDISRLGRRIDVLSPFLCGVAGCMHRKKVSLMENIDDESFATHDDDDEQQQKDE